MNLFRRILNGPDPEDIIPGDWVRVIGYRGVGLVESVNGDTALVSREPDKRELHPIKGLRRVKQRGSLYDSRSFE